MNKKARQYERGEVVSVYLNKDTTDELISWLNKVKDVGPSIIEALE